MIMLCGTKGTRKSFLRFTGKDLTGFNESASSMDGMDAGLSETTHESHKFHTGGLWKTRALKFRREIDESESQTSAWRTSRNGFADVILQLRGLGMLNTITSGLASAITQLVGWPEKNIEILHIYGHLHFIQQK